MEPAGIIVWLGIGIAYTLRVISKRKKRESNIHRDFKVFNKSKY